MLKTKPTPSRQYLRKQGVAERYAVNVRTVDRMQRDGRIPPARYLRGSRFPIWAIDELDANDRQATLTPATARSA